MPADYTNLISIITLIVVGLLAIPAVFDKTRRDRAKLASEETTELINILKEKIDALESRVKTAEENAAQAKIEVADIKKENNRLIEILQGRDQNTQEYQKLGVQAMQTAFETHKAVLANGHKIEAVNKNVERLATAIESHLDEMGEKKA